MKIQTCNLPAHSQSRAMSQRDSGVDGRAMGVVSVGAMLNRY